MTSRLVVLAGTTLLLGMGACGGPETANDSAQAPVDSGLTVNTPLTDNVDTTKADTVKTDPKAGTGKRP